jgi:hypothetical protein
VRRLADLPVAGRNVSIEPHVRRLVCPSTSCSQRTFRQQVPDVAARYAAAQRAVQRDRRPPGGGHADRPAGSECSSKRSRGVCGLRPVPTQRAAAFAEQRCHDQPTRLSFVTSIR